LNRKKLTGNEVQRGSGTVRIITWNVNGIRAVMKKDFKAWLTTEKPDICCLQETKIHAAMVADAALDVDGYHDFWACADRKGYSGVCVYTRTQPLSVETGMPGWHDDEGRILRLEYPGFILMNIYFPNGQSGDERLQYKLDFYDHFNAYARSLAQEGKGVIVCGDYNTAHHPIDLKNPEDNEDYSGFMPIERERLDHLIQAGYVDVFRTMYPTTVQYSWWTYRFKARERNIGWRIDYFFVTENLMAAVADCRIRDQVYGSDHCPVELILN
jgi:exodeoxyribonuclease-3